MRDRTDKVRNATAYLEDWGGLFVRSEEGPRDVLAAPGTSWFLIKRGQAFCINGNRKSEKFDCRSGMKGKSTCAFFRVGALCDLFLNVDRHVDVRPITPSSPEASGLGRWKSGQGWKTRTLIATIPSPADKCERFTHRRRQDVLLGCRW